LAFGSTFENLVHRARRQVGTCGQSIGMRANRRVTLDGDRIVGGVEARPNSHPWIVSLQQYGRHFCGGTLIRVGNAEQTDIVVTAAHCVYDGVNDLTATAGAHNFDRPQAGEQTVRATSYVFHPDYNADTYVNDIAIVKLATPVKFSSTIQPACLPASGETVPDNVQGTVAGWGRTAENAYDTSRILMQVGVPTISNRICGAYLGLYDITPREMLCAGYAAGARDSCQGDSGGPLVFQSGKSFVLQGVVSFGEGCAREGNPGVYARVSSYIPWIQSVAKSLSPLAG